jgi:hypothetical protein
MRQTLALAALALILALGLPSASAAEEICPKPAVASEASAVSVTLPGLESLDGTHGWVQRTCTATCPGSSVSCTGQTECHLTYVGKLDRFYVVCDGHYTLCPDF